MKKVLVVMGGTSSEHEISLKTGSFIFQNLDRNKYVVTPAIIDKTGKWIISSQPEGGLPNPEGELSTLSIRFIEEFMSSRSTIEPSDFSKALKQQDCVFIGLHGGQGEDGTIQGFLDHLYVPYTGSRVLASSLAMDKEKANIIFGSSGLKVAPFLCAEKKYMENGKFLNYLEEIQFPVFAKPNNGGSSVGTKKIKSKEEIIPSLKELFLSSEKILIQEFISGTEVSCGVVERSKNNFNPEPLFPTEIVPGNEFFDYEAKYKSGGSEEITPARLDESVTRDIRIKALQAHITLGCRGYSRTDFIIKDKTPYILETNTLPGMTETSLIPQQARHSGISMQEIFSDLIENSLRK